MFKMYDVFTLTASDMQNLVDVVLDSLSITQPTKVNNACNHRLHLLNSAVHLCNDLLTLQCRELRR